MKIKIICFVIVFIFIVLACKEVDLSNEMKYISVDTCKISIIGFDTNIGNIYLLEYDNKKFLTTYKGGIIQIQENK